MISETYYISGSFAIKNGGLYEDCQKVFQHTNGSLEATLSELVKKYEVIHPRFGKMDRIAKLGYTSVEILLKKFDISEYLEDELALIIANNSSCLDTDFAYQATTSGIPSPALFVYTVPNIVLAEICIKNKIKGENMFFISDTFRASEMIHNIQEIFSQNRAKACILGWVEVFGNNYESFTVLVEKKARIELAEKLNIVNLENRFKNI